MNFMMNELEEKARKYKNGNPHLWRACIIGTVSLPGAIKMFESISGTKHEEIKKPNLSKKQVRIQLNEMI